MAKIKLEIISPNKVVYSADIDMLIVRSIAGDLGIMPKHAPLLAGLVPHAMRAIIDGTENLIAVSGGFIQVQPDKIIVLASAAELPIEIDINRARKAYERAQKRLESFKEIQKLRVMLIHFALELHSNVLKQDLKQLKQILVNI